jgi:pilus assembly protein Flp/PilA
MTTERPNHSTTELAHYANPLKSQHFDFWLGTRLWHATCLIHVGVRPSIENLRRNKEMKQLMIKLYREEAGQDLTEYALLLVLVALVAITTMKTLGTTISSVFSNAAANLSSAT